MTHDLKNILNPRGMQLQLLRRRVARDPAQAGEVMDQMADVLKLGNEILERLRLLVRRDAEATAEPCDLAEAARHAVEICRPRIRDNPYLEAWVEAVGGPSARVRKSDLASALVNLIVNACEAMTGGGRITLRTGGAEGRAWVEIEDDGPGMPPELQKHIFDAFFTSKKTGTGLGLSVVSTFVQQSGGAIHVESAEGRGTRIRMEFPEAIAPAEQPGLVRSAALSG